MKANGATRFDPPLNELGGDPERSRRDADDRGGQASVQQRVGFKPALELLPYQQRWLGDSSPLKIVVKARQIGFSFAATLRAVFECLRPKTTWIFLSKGERQSRLLMEKVQEHIQSCGIVARTSESSFFEGTMTKQLEARFPNGSVIYGLPANPDTARGYTGNVTLDEFAFHQDAAKVFSALYPTITRGYQLEVVSTPNGQQGKFFEIAKAAGLTSSGEWKVVSDKQALTPNPSSSGEWRVVSGKQELTPNPSSSGEWRVVSGKQELTPNHLPPITSSWSGHRVDIYQAVAQGFQIDIEGLRAGCDDEETWLQEYCCEFLSDAQNYIPMELIMGCVSEQATTDCHPESLRGARDLFLGVDIGRKRDLTVAWLFEKTGDVLWSRVLLTMKGQTFDIQERAICDLIEGSGQGLVVSDKSDHLSLTTNHSAMVRRCAIDQSGLGMMLAERLAKKYGALVEPVQFTAQIKERIAPMVKQAFEDRLVRIPDNREIRADVNAVKRFVTPAGNIRFDAEHTDKGHADRFWALALALNAASAPALRFTEAAALVGEPIAAGMMDKVI